MRSFAFLPVLERCVHSLPCLTLFFPSPTPRPVELLSILSVLFLPNCSLLATTRLFIHSFVSSRSSSRTLRRLESNVLLLHRTRPPRPTSAPLAVLDHSACSATQPVLPRSPQLIYFRAAPTEAVLLITDKQRIRPEGRILYDSRSGTEDRRTDRGESGQSTTAATSQLLSLDQSNRRGCLPAAWPASWPAYVASTISPRLLPRQAPP